MNSFRAETKIQIIFKLFQSTWQQNVLINKSLAIDTSEIGLREDCGLLILKRLTINSPIQSTFIELLHDSRPWTWWQKINKENDIACALPSIPSLVEKAEEKQL